MSDNARSLSSGELVDLLRNVNLFDGLPDGDLARVAGIARGATVPAGHVLFREGDAGDVFYVVFEGAVEMVKARPDGAEDRLAVRRGGDAFGEMALLTDTPRSATARTVEESLLVTLSRTDFQALLGGDTFPTHILRGLARALQAMDVRFASSDKAPSTGGQAAAHELSRLMQAGLLPGAAPRIDGYEVAAGTTTESTGRGGSVWDWLTLQDGRAALLTLDVREDGFPRAHHLGVARAVLRGLAGHHATVPGLLARANDALASAAIQGLDQFVEAGVLVASGTSLEWASAGRVPGGIIRRDGTFEEFGAHGPPLGMMGGFHYNVQTFEMSAGDTAFVLSHASQGLFLGAADLLAQLHGKPAGEVVSTLHRAIRKAQGDERVETSVLYARRH